MVDFHRLTVPIIIILIVGGTASFLLAYGFYPKKNINVNIAGTCYEFLGNAFAEYKRLDAKKEMKILELQYHAVEPANAIIPITFSGTKDEIAEFTDQYKIDIIEKQQVGDISNDNSYIDKYIVKGKIAKPHFKEILDGLNLQDFDPLKGTIRGSIGLQPNSFIDLQEGRTISTSINDFMKRGIQEIIEGDHDGIRPAECRSKIQY